MKIMGTAALSAFAAAGGALVLLTRQAINNADHMGKLAQATGMSVENFSALDYAARRSDVETATLAKSLVILAKNLGKANQLTLEGKAAHSALGTLFRGNIPVFQDTSDAFQQIAAKLSQLPVGLERTNLGAQILGKGFVSLEPMLPTLTEVTERFRRMGLEIGGPTAARAAEFNERLKDLKAGASALGLGIASELLPKLTQLTTAFGDVNRAGLGQALGREASNAIIVWQKVGVAILLASAQIKLAEQKILGFDTQKMQGAVNELRDALQGLRLEQMQTLGEITLLPAGKPGKATTDPAALARAAAAAEAAAAAQKKLQDALSGAAEKLRQEIAVLQFGAAGAELFSLKTMGASKAQLDLVASLQTSFAAQKQAAAAAKDSAAAYATLQAGLMPAMIQSSNELDMSFENLRQAGVQVFQSTRTEIEKAGLELRRLNELFKAGAIDQDTFARASARLKENLTSAKAQMPDFSVHMKDLTQSTRQWAESSMQAFGDWLIMGGSFRKMLAGILQDLARMLFQVLVIEPLIRGLFGGFGGAANGALIPGRAGGGPTFGPGPFWVGEQGPELFWPPKSGGVIVPHGASEAMAGGAFGGGGIVQHIAIDARGADVGTVTRISALVSREHVKALAAAIQDRQARVA